MSINASEEIPSRVSVLSSNSLARLGQVSHIGGGRLAQFVLLGADGDLLIDKIAEPVEGTWSVP